MQIKKISIIGLGLIGGSIAKALKVSDYDFVISAYDKNSEVIKTALSENVIDVTLADIQGALNSDLIFLCLPTDASLETFSKLIPSLKPQTIISDVCGVKSIFEEKWIEVNSRGYYIGGHPMTGKEVGGYENSDAELFDNSIYILSKFSESCPRINDFIKIIEILGARQVYLYPELHDKVVARVSHLPQLLSIALINSLGENKEGINFLDYAAGGFRDMTRIASSPFSNWKSILDHNREEIITAIEFLQHNMIKIEDLIQQADFEKLDNLFSEARLKREKIAKNSKGFINPLFDVYFQLNDTPGSLSEVLLLLLKNSLNVKDIELQKYNEKLGGVFRISFNLKGEAITAKNVLSEAGYKLR